MYIDDEMSSPMCRINGVRVRRIYELKPILQI